MIRSIIDHIDAQLSTLGLFTKFYGLTKLEHRGDQSFPVFYSGGGSADGINFDFTKANIYHRITGEIKISQGDSDTVGCDISITETYPMRAVCYFANSATTDDAYSVLKVLANVKNSIPAVLDVSDINLDLCQLVVTGGEVDSFNAWSQEFKGIDYRVPSTHNLIIVNYDIILTGAQSCFETICA